jgi:hypothetical protein
MTEIKVIVDVDSSTMENMSTEERLLLFNQMAADNTELPLQTFITFAELYEEQLQFTTRLARPSFNELIIRKIILLSQVHAYTNYYVVPITTDIESNSTIKVRFEDRVYTVNSNGLDKIYPSNVEVIISGLVFSPISGPAQTLYSKDRLGPLKGAYKLPNIHDSLFILGAYSHPIAVESNIFTSISNDAYIGNIPVLSPVVVNFTKDKLSETLLGILDYFISYELYKYGSNSAYYIYAQIRTALKPDQSTALSLLYRSLQDDPIVYTPSPPLAPQQDIIPLLESLHKGKFTLQYKYALLADIYLRGFANVYYQSISKGVDDPGVRALLDIQRTRFERVAFLYNLKQRQIDKTNELNTYKIIIADKFGTLRLTEIEREITTKPTILSHANGILSLLKTSERKAVEIEFKRRAEYLEAVLNNKCPHVKLYSRFRSAKGDFDKKKIFKELSEYFGDITPDMPILCNKCDFTILCPHLRDLTQLEIAGKQYKEIKAAMSKYIDYSRETSSKCCKICGEIMDNELLDVEENTTSMDEDLKNFMYGEMISLIQYLKFDTVINIPNFVNGMRAACYLYIFDKEKQILKSKTNSAAEIKAKKRLFTTIYGFAYIITIIQNNQGVSFKDYKSKEKNKLVGLIKHVINLIINSRNVTIREISNMTVDVIKNNLIEAYKELRNVDSKQVITYSEVEDTVITLMLDPVYKYLYHIMVMEDIAGGKSVKKANPVDYIDRVLGVTVPVAEKQMDIFEHAHIVKEKEKWNTKSFTNIQPMTGGAPGNTWDKLYPSYALRSYQLFTSKVKSRLFMEPMYIDAGDKKTIEATMLPLHAAACKEYADFALAESRLLKYKAALYPVVVGRIGSGKSRQFTKRDTHIGRIYDETGNTHDFSILIVQEGKKITEMTREIIAKIVEKGTQFNGIITDKKCAKCNILLSQTSKLDLSKINESLYNKDAIANFYQFYENRCLVSGIHEWVNNVCNKCKMPRDSKAQQLYYREHKDTYIQDKRESIVSVIQTQSQKTNTTIVDTSELDKWIFNFNIILDLANKIQVNQKILIALGAVEGKEYSEVESGAYIPIEADARNDTRIYVLNGCIKTLITEYNQLKYFHKLARPLSDITDIINSSGINKYQLTELHKKLPDIYNDYNPKFAYIQRTRKPHDIEQFCLQSFCEMAIKIWIDTNKETEKLRQGFVQYIVKKILRGDEMLTKPGHFSWALIYGDKDGNDSNYVDGDEYDEQEEGALDDDEETPAPFSQDAFDVEQDGDEEGNQIRVGENMGLD